MLARNRILTVPMMASYLLAVSASAFFHHHDDHDEEQSRPGFTSSHGTDEHGCSVCQFLAQKPAPVAEVTSVSFSALVQEVAVPSPACSVAGIFTAWHSRAPPASA